MSVYNIPAWSKDIDPLFTTDKSMLLSASDIYPNRRMSDSALSADTGTTTSATTSGTTDPDSASPATEPDAISSPPGLSPSLDPSLHPLDLAHHAHALDGDHPGRKPSLPGIGALPLLEADDTLAAGFPRRASLPTLTSDLSLCGGLQSRPSPRHSPLAFRPRTVVGAVGSAGYGTGQGYEGTHLSAYAFPTSDGDAAHPHHVRGGFSYGTSPTSPFSTPTSSTTSTPGAFSSPFTSPLDGHGLAYAHTNGGTLGGITAWGTTTSPVPASPPRLGVPKRRRSPGSQSPAGTQPSTQAGKPVSNNPPQSNANTTAVTNPADPPRRPRGKLPKHTTDLLKEWLHAHSDHPYPSEDEKRDLCARTKLSMSQVSNWMINARRRILAPAKPPSVSATTTEPYRLASAHHPHGLTAAHLAHHHMAPSHLGHHLQPAHLQSSHLAPHHTHLQSSHLGPHHGHGMQSSHLLGPPASFAPAHTHHLQSSAYGGSSYPSHLQSGGLGAHHGGGLGMQSMHGHGTRPISSLYASHSGHPHSLPLPLPLPAPHPHASLTAHPSSGMYASPASSQTHMMRRVASEDSLRLYEPSNQASSQDYPRYSTSQSQGLYGTSTSERRLSYPTTTVGGSPGGYNSSGLFLSGTAQDGTAQEQGQGSSPASIGGDLHQQSVSPKREADGF